MELLAPAGNLEKLQVAYRFGADAAYIGFQGFSLRTKADAFGSEHATQVAKIKGSRKLYGVFNIYHDQLSLERLEAAGDAIGTLPFDAFVIADLGVLRWFQRTFPKTDLHLSTQANCLNSEAAKLYRDLGFRRIVLSRETSLTDIEAIRKAVPEVELEVFVHGAMCLAYSGRCFLSRWMAGKDRSANRGACAHSCRWNFRVLEERQRQGEYFPIEEGEGYTSILSSRDLNLIDHLADLQDAGVDSLKIEGRMKSVYYCALAVRAYRAAMDRLSGTDVPWYNEARDELWKISHREYSTGFLYGDEEISQPAENGYQYESYFCGTIGPLLDNGEWTLDVRNPIQPGEPLEFVPPQGPSLACAYEILDENCQTPRQADHMKPYTIRVGGPICEGTIVRKPGTSS